MLSVTTPTYNTHLYVYAQSSVLLKKDSRLRHYIQGHSQFCMGVLCFTQNCAVMVCVNLIIYQCKL